MIFNRSMFLFLLQYLVIIDGQPISGYQHHYPPHHSLQTDRAALLAFKKTISSDPYSVLSNWNEVTQVCNFTGVRCNTKRHRATKLILRNAELVGMLSPFIANLTRLRVLQLVNNNFSGIIPPEFSSLQHLSLLWLEGNNLEGEIPDSFSHLTKLALVNLQANKLTGKIPASFFSNCTMLKNVDLSMNFLTGEIPTEIGNCPGLWNLALYNNQLTGEIPFSITNASLMFNLDVENNHLKGELPSEIAANLPELLYLHLSYNNMVSHDNNSNLVPFFTALKNCTILDELELAGMGLGGNLPSSIGQLVGNLTSLLLQENRIAGSIPPTLVNLTQLTVLNLTYNFLSGTIPGEISTLPIELSKLENVQEIDLSSNNLTGIVFPQISSCIALRLINLSHNFLRGQLPETLGDLKNLEAFDVSGNLLSGTIPTSLNKIHTLTFLNLSCNNFAGTIPSGGIFDSVTNLSFLLNWELCGSVPVFIAAICCVIGCRA
ncbi:putative leucine-rich repeat receptor-like serine/threonine-protein kinase [Camellia lanceoleosa]|uniref:Leucine-rich repeat receptor-like serine/threonine-protein kinase n=1 Tax=Camellia lanceoleosa TaxID=1840588 RepID=A0ACC0I407_9ERIC|nr:putative leucine-rich repeat receptor-like serine/threonine-protein kinase [Camellia lanceoleosa]